MSNLKGFLKQNEIRKENLKIAVSDRFLGEDGKPLEWEIKQIAATESEKIRKVCLKTIYSGKSKKEVRTEFDSSLYALKVTVASIVYPDLNSAELQDSWGCVGAESLIQEMLVAGELANLEEKVAEFNGFDTDMNGKVDEAKN